MDITLTTTTGAVDPGRVEPLEVVLTERRAVDLVRHASALCRPLA